MIENEDSVVTSLNELRKLKHERITRQTQSRSLVGSARAVALTADPVVDQMTPPPVQGLSLVSSQPSFQNTTTSTGFGGVGSFAPTSSGFDAGRVPVQTVVQTKPSMKAAVVVAVALIAAGGVGYMKLQTDTQAQLAAKDEAIKQAEDARNKAAETAAKADVQSRNSLRQCEDKLKLALAAAPAAAAPAPGLAASAPALAPAIEKKPEKVSSPKVAAHAPSHKSAAHPARRTAQSDAPEAKSSADVPTIAKKKKLDNDPLAGLGKL